MNALKLYLLERTDDCCHYDTYDSVVVAAFSEDDAKLINPDGSKDNVGSDAYHHLNGGQWVCKLDQIEVKLIGIAGADVLRGVILASFNAG